MSRSGEFHNGIQEHWSQAARDAHDSNYGGESYWAHLDSHAQELAAKFPDKADHYKNRSLGDALRGNNGL